MKVLVAAIATVAIAGVLVALRLPWSSVSARREGPVRFNFLVALGVVALGIIFAVFWFMMRPK